jgi:hypothetical protein
MPGPHSASSGLSPSLSLGSALAPWILLGLVEEVPAGRGLHLVGFHDSECASGRDELGSDWQSGGSLWRDDTWPAVAGVSRGSCLTEAPRAR